MRHTTKIVIALLALAFMFSFLPAIVHDFLKFLDFVFVTIQLNLANLILGFICSSLLYISVSVRYLKKTLDRLLQLQLPNVAAVAVEFYQKINGELVKVDNMFMKVESVADLSAAFKGKLKDGTLVDAKVDGKPQWELLNPELGLLEVSEDGLSAVFTAGQKAVVGQIQLKADADLGEGVKEIIGTLDVELSPPEAEVVEIAAVVRP